MKIKTHSNKINHNLLASRLILSGFVVASFGLFGVSVANAATTATSKLEQVISAGTLSTDIRDSGGGVLSTPTFSMNSASVSNSQQTITGTFGESAKRITVDNPGGANSGWTLTLGATTPSTAKWVSGGNNYAFNGASASVGQLTVDASAGTLTSVTGTSTGITKGSSATYSGTTPIAILTASAGSDDIWLGYITGVGLSQTIPASQPAGTYTIDMTQTVTAN